MDTYSHNHRLVNGRLSNSMEQNRKQEQSTTQSLHPNTKAKISQRIYVLAQTQHDQHQMPFNRRHKNVTLNSHE